MRYRIIELGEEDLDKFIDFDAKISWNFIEKSIRENLTWKEFREKHRNLVRKLYEQNMVNKIFIALDSSNKIVGAVWMGVKIDTVNYIPIAYIYDLEVIEEARGIGIGSKLLKLVEEYCHQNNIRKIALSTMVYNQHAIKWYLRKGFQVKRLYLEKEL